MVSAWVIGGGVWKYRDEKNRVGVEGWDMRNSI